MLIRTMINQDVYRARIWSNNSTLITFPAWENTLLYNRDTYEAGLKVTNAPAGIIDAVDDALRTYHDNLNGNQESEYDVQQADKIKHVLLEFNDNITLSSKLICTHDKQEDEIKLPTITFDKEYRIDNPGKVNSQSDVIFVVSIDGKPKKIGKIEATRVGLLARQMGNCTVASPPATTGRPNQAHPAANFNPTYNVPMSVGNVPRPAAKRYRHPAAVAAGGAGPFPFAYQQPATGAYKLNNPTAAAPVDGGGGVPVGVGAPAPAAGDGWGSWWPYGTNQAQQVPPLNQQA